MSSGHAPIPGAKDHHIHQAADHHETVEKVVRRQLPDIVRCFPELVMR
jgi:hypothetical protein